MKSPHYKHFDWDLNRAYLTGFKVYTGKYGDIERLRFLASDGSKTDTPGYRSGYKEEKDTVEFKDIRDGFSPALKVCTLRLGRFETIISWSYDIVLTLAPACFFGLALAALRLDHQPISLYGERVVNLTILSPSVYPIVFAAVASRFFKNLARWRLEKRQGIELATLEQVFGSQNLAGAVERLLFVRAKIPIGIAILLIWCLSPIGGQSAARLLRKEGLIQNGTVFYTHAASQDLKRVASEVSRSSVTALYSTSFLSSSSMKKNLVDFWDWPRIPQWPENADPDSTRAIHLDDIARGKESYASLLGIHIQGLDEFNAEAQYQFSVESLYHDISCNEPEVGVYLNNTTNKIPESWSNMTELFEPPDGIPTSFAALISSPNLTDLYPNPESNPTLLDDLPPSHLLYALVDMWIEFENDTKPLTIFNCSIHPVVVETDIVCNSSVISTSCLATHQRKAKKYYNSQDNPYTALMTILSQKDMIHRQWSAAEGIYNRLLTPQYIANTERFRFTFDDGFNKKLFSTRMTTAFNTFVDATVYYTDHTYASFRLQPGEDTLPGTNRGSAMNTTEAVVKSKEEVYRVNKTWLTILIIITEILGLLGILGLILQLFIRGPDILGFASSLTRENVYMELPPGGSALDGPARARALGSLRVHLADVKPKDEKGYIAFTPAYAFKQDDEEEEGSWKDLSSKRHYQ
ncbi:uncharacterized protein FIESC28_02817 [Fusarium coffeatum]|uniref:Uncharacterized protein n=1 Tax=Fusarium coffeatum TaxID=231269 RepID=A0A366S4R4_9HYPO|nr:uncharacterized protein FIESC28_02817 [Fusarium coffeatum]RBR24327.1 hypothetical protein FIESC28_02817 [Fusarium coffeatum]